MHETGHENQHMKSFIISILALIIFFPVAKAQDANAIANPLKPDQEKAYTIFSMAMKYFRKARFDSAGYLLNKGVGFAEKAGNDELMADYLIQQSHILFFAEKFEEGLTLLRTAYPHLQHISPGDRTREYLLLTGRFFENLHHNDSALYYYHQCELLNSRENPYDNFRVYYNIAQMFKRADAFNESEKYFLKAYQLTKPAGIRKDNLIVLIEFADLYYLWGKPEKFAPLMEEQEKIMKEIEKTFPNAQAHIMYFIDQEKEPLEKKVLFMENVKRELKKGEYVGKAALANTIIAGLYEKNDQPDIALKYIIENLELFENENDITSLYSNSKIAYRLMKKAGMVKEALSEADKLFILKDSIIAQQQRELVLDIETKYETEKKEKNIALLHSENQLSAARLAKEKDLEKALMLENALKDSVVNKEKNYNKLLAYQNSLRESQLENEKVLKAAVSRENILKENQLAKEKRIEWLLISGALLLLVFGCAIFFMYRRQKSKNALIQKQSDDLQMLMKEIHHRVKNNLQVISSLLDLQSLNVKDRRASEAIKESRNRVYSMALIHQNLYKDDNILGIEMNDYINKLVQSLFESYNVRENKITLETDIDPLLLDVDLVIPIGLVLNELVSNCLKYAFKNTGLGTLFIGLKKYENETLLTVKDNGAGFPKGMNVFQSTSFGFKLVKAFAQKLKGNLEVYNNDGACVLLRIKN